MKIKTLKKTLFALIALSISLVASDKVQKQLEVTQDNIDGINYILFLSKKDNLVCADNGSELMHYQQKCILNIDKAKQDLLRAKIQQAIEYFRKNSIDVVTVKTTNEASSSIFKDADTLLNQEATLEASVRYLKESGRKDYKAVYIAPKVINGKYVVGQIMYGKLD